MAPVVAPGRHGAGAGPVPGLRPRAHQPGGIAGQPDTDGPAPQQMASLQLQNITAQSDYQQLWQNLTLPVKALPVLRLELQQLGVPSESLMNLNEQNFPQGITLNQVWQLLQQAGQTSSTAAARAPP